MDWYGAPVGLLPLVTGPLSTTPVTKYTCRCGHTQNQCSTIMLLVTIAIWGYFAGKAHIQQTQVLEASEFIFAELPEHLNPMGGATQATLHSCYGINDWRPCDSQKNSFCPRDQHWKPEETQSNSRVAHVSGGSSFKVKPSLLQRQTIFIHYQPRLLSIPARPSSCGGV